MYALHFLLPFVVLAGLVVHLAMLHTMGSGSASTVYQWYHYPYSVHGILLGLVVPYPQHV